MFGHKKHKLSVLTTQRRFRSIVQCARYSYPCDPFNHILLFSFPIGMTFLRSKTRLQIKSVLLNPTSRQRTIDPIACKLHQLTILVFGPNQLCINSIAWSGNTQIPIHCPIHKKKKKETANPDGSTLVSHSWYPSAIITHGLKLVFRHSLLSSGCDLLFQVSTWMSLLGQHQAPSLHMPTHQSDS